MLEAETSGTHSAKIIENDILRELFATDTVFLAAITLNRDLHEKSHLSVKIKKSSILTIADCGPSTVCGNEVLV
jgi:hypothetical protein